MQIALTASWMAELGHRGDLQVLDDAEVGYLHFIGTGRWVPENLTDGLGTRWDFPPSTTTSRTRTAASCTPRWTL